MHDFYLQSTGPGSQWCSARVGFSIVFQALVWTVTSMPRQLLRVSGCEEGIQHHGQTGEVSCRKPQSCSTYLHFSSHRSRHIKFKSVLVVKDEISQYGKLAFLNVQTVHSYMQPWLHTGAMFSISEQRIPEPVFDLFTQHPL